jgi:hypothetical protein
VCGAAGRGGHERSRPLDLVHRGRRDTGARRPEQREGRGESRGGSADECAQGRDACPELGCRTRCDPGRDRRPRSEDGGRGARAAARSHGRNDWASNALRRVKKRRRCERDNIAVAERLLVVKPFSSEAAAPRAAGRESRIGAVSRCCSPRASKAAPPTRLPRRELHDGRERAVSRVMRPGSRRGARDEQDEAGREVETANARHELGRPRGGNRACAKRPLLQLVACNAAAAIGTR